MILSRPITEPIRSELTQEQRWKGEDNGLITCWETGRLLAIKQPAVAESACKGQLVPLVWKGGLEADLKSKRKTGTLFYLATWQGLRGNDLCIDTEKTPQITCTRFGVTVTFSGKFEDYANA